MSWSRVEKVTRQRPSLPDIIEDYDYNALGALKLNAGVALDMRRPRLDGNGLTDSALPNTPPFRFQQERHGRGGDADAQRGPADALEGALSGFPHGLVRRQGQAAGAGDRCVYNHR
jgi:hypothetical protein